MDKQNPFDALPTGDLLTAMRAWPSTEGRGGDPLSSGYVAELLAAAARTIERSIPTESVPTDQYQPLPLPDEGDRPTEASREESGLVTYARGELAHMLGGEDKDERSLAQSLVDCVRVFSAYGHSGGSASWAVPVLGKLLAYQPIRPLTGEADEWLILDYDGLYAQNKRCSRVFARKDGTAYDIEAVAFEDPDGSRWLNGDSHRDITFPYTPTTEVVKRPAEGSDGDGTLQDTYRP